MATLEENLTEGFEASSVEEAEKEVSQLAKEWSEEVKGSVSRDEDGGFVSNDKTKEKQAKISGIRDAYDNLTAFVAKARAKLETPVEPTFKAEVYDGLSGKALDAQAKRDAEAYKAIMKAGRNKYQEGDVSKPHIQHPGEVDLGQPLIARNPVTGYNEVHPFPFVEVSSDATNDENIEASFRNAEIIRANKSNEFDARTGNRVRHQAQADTGDINLITVGGDLYKEMVREDTIMSICKIEQSAGINTYKTTARTGIPTAAPVAQNTDILDTYEDNFRNIDITPIKYGMIMQYTYESSFTREPWEMGQLLSSDAGMGLRNGFNRHILTGDSGANPVQLGGIVPQMKATPATYTVQGVANADFLAGTNAFGVTEMAAFATSFAKEYQKQPGKRLVTTLVTWGKLMGLEDTRGRKLFSDSNASVDDLQLSEYNVRVMLDDNLEDGNATNEIPMIIGDFGGYCVVLAGGPRMDFSTEYAFQQDRLAIRALQHIGGVGIVDQKAAKGYRLQ